MRDMIRKTVMMMTMTVMMLTVSYTYHLIKERANGPEHWRGSDITSKNLRKNNKAYTLHPLKGKADDPEHSRGTIANP